jgi:hypothetical protein
VFENKQNTICGNEKYAKNGLKTGDFNVKGGTGRKKYLWEVEEMCRCKF